MRDEILLWLVIAGLFWLAVQVTERKRR